MIPEVKGGTLLQDEQMDGDITTGWVRYGAGRRVCIQASWHDGSTPVGNLIVQHTNEIGKLGLDESTARSVDVAGATLAISGDEDAGIIEITDTGAQAFRCFYDRTSGDGQLDITYNIKEP